MAEQARQNPAKATTFRGIDNVNEPEAIGLEWFREAVNVDMTAEGGVETRQGFSLLLPDIKHSLWAGSLCLGIGDGILRQLAADLASTADLLTVSDRPMVYAEVDDGDIHFTNNDIHGVLSAGVASILSRAGVYERSAFKIDQSEEEVYFDSPPLGYLVEWAFGRLFVVDDDGVWFSQSYFPRRFDMENDYNPISGVTMFKAVAGGFYIGTREKVYFQPGGNPKSKTLHTVSKSGAILGTGLLCSGKTFGLEGMGDADICVWESVDGRKLAGSPAGGVQDMTHNRVARPDSDRGASILRELRGQAHHVSLLQEKKDDNQNFRASDFSVAEVRRNGQLI